MVLLDIMLPVMDGWAVCAHIREKAKTPIIMLTAKSEVNDRITGLEMGADDYLVKPFEMKELMARINAVLRRSEIPDDTKKRRLVAAVAGDLGHLRVRAGGYTSVDVSAGNTDKAFALRELAGRLGIGIGDIIFVGDRMTPGGNDYPAAQAGAIALQVTGPQDTVRLCDILLPLLGGEPVRQDG